MGHNVQPKIKKNMTFYEQIILSAVNLFHWNSVGILKLELSQVRVIWSHGILENEFRYLSIRILCVRNLFLKLFVKLFKLESNSNHQDSCWTFFYPNDSDVIMWPESRVGKTAFIWTGIYPKHFSGRGYRFCLKINIGRVPNAKNEVQKGTAQVISESNF